MTQTIDPYATMRNNLIAAALGLQQSTKTAANLVPIPGGERVIAIGTRADVAQLLEIAPDARRAQPAGTGDLAGEREMFEAFARKACHMPDYVNVNWQAEWVLAAWEGWQGRAALTHPSVSASPKQALPAAARAAERVDAMHKGVVGVFAAIKAEHLATQQPSAAPSVQQAGDERLEMLIHSITGYEGEDDAFTYLRRALSELMEYRRVADAAQQAGAPAQAQPDSIRDALKFIHDAFKRDLDAGYKTRDKEFAVSIAAEALSASPSAPAVQAEPTDEQIIAALHSCGIDTRPSKYGFPEVQVDGTTIPNLRRVFAKLYTGAAPAGLTLKGYRITDPASGNVMWQGVDGLPGVPYKNDGYQIEYLYTVDTGAAPAGAAQDEQSQGLHDICQSFGWRTDGDAAVLVDRIEHHIREMKAGIAARNTVIEEQRAAQTTTASASDERLACVKCHSTKRENWDACPECGGKEFKTWANLTASWGRAPAPSRSAAHAEPIGEVRYERVNDDWEAVFFDYEKLTDRAKLYLTPPAGGEDAINLTALIDECREAVMWWEPLRPFIEKFDAALSTMQQSTDAGGAE